jgi:hypothetical protein
MLWLEDKSNGLATGCAPSFEVSRAIEDHGLKNSNNAIEN